MIVFNRGKESYIYYIDDMSIEALEIVMNTYELQGFEADTTHMYKNNGRH